MSTTAVQSQTNITPILDLLESLPPPAKPTVGSQIIGFFVTFSLIVLPVAIVTGEPVLFERFVEKILRVFPRQWTLTSFVLFSISCVLGAILPIVLHEAGHALVGIWMGFSFNSLRIGLLQFDRPFRISLYRGKSAGAAGWTSMFPVKLDRLRIRAVAMLLGGPGTNLLSAGVLVLLPFAKGLSSAFFIIVSIILGLTNLLPFRGRAVFSDGARILMLLRNRQRGERWLALLGLIAEVRNGVMPESYSSTYLAKATAIVDNSPDTVTAHVFAYSAAFHLNKDEEAAQLLEVCLRLSGYTSPVMREALMSDAAVFQARRRKRVDLARRWLEVIPANSTMPWSRPRAEAAILEGQGDAAGALRKLDEAEKLICGAPNPAQREIALRFLERWKSEIREHLGQGTDHLAP